MMNQNSTSSQTFCVRKLKVLADVTRLSVLQILMQGPKHVGEIEKLLGIEQSLLSHHLKVLRKEGFAIAIRDGKAVSYSLAPGVKPDSNNAINIGCCLLWFD